MNAAPTRVLPRTRNTICGRVASSGCSRITVSPSAVIDPTPCTWIPCRSDQNQPRALGVGFLPQDAGGDRASVQLCCFPVLFASVQGAVAVASARDVTGCEHRRVARAEVLVHEHSAVHLESRGLREFGRRDRPDAHEYRVGRQFLAGGEHDGHGVAGLPDLRDARGVHRDAVLGVLVVQVARQFRAHRGNDRRVDRSTSVTWAPSCSAAEAVSAPIRPAPITTRRAPGTSRALSARASSMVRSRCTCGRSPPGTGSGRAPAPVVRMVTSASRRVPSASSTTPSSGFSAVTGDRCAA